MEKNFAETLRRVPDTRQSTELGAPSEKASTSGRKKRRGEHCLNVYVTYELKERLAEQHGLSTADLIRQVIKAGLPVFEALDAAQKELIGGYVLLLRTHRIIGELKQ